MIAATTRHWLDSRPVADRATNGDFAECFQLDDDRFAIIVGDIAGRGPAAGAAAGALLAYTRCAVMSREPLRTALRTVDAFFTRGVICDDIPLASLFIGVIDSKDAMLDYASAGHEPALLFPTLTQHEHLEPTGPLLGLGRLAELEFGQRRVSFYHDSVLAIVTDGITESRRYEDGRPRFFGSAGVARALVRARRERNDPARAIGDAAFGHAGHRRLDDATAVVVGRPL